MYFINLIKLGFSKVVCNI